MRYIILFIISILLPVFAFFNFNDADISLFSRINGQVQKYTDKTIGFVFQDGAKEKAANISAASTLKSQPLGASDKETKNVYKIPELKYTYPAQFPQTATVNYAYLEGFKNPNFFPIRNWGVDIEDVNAASAIAVESTTHKVLYNKSIFDSRPIASLTKLMTALIVIDEMDLQSVVRISGNAISTPGDRGVLVIDEKITVENLLYILLITSSNDAAIALEEYYNSFRVEGDKTFVAAMNAKAQALGLLDTFFVEPSGLNINNRSTVYDLAKLADYVFQRPILRQIMSVKVIDVRSQDGVVNHHLVNSNKLLGVLEGVLAGKTGFTEEAGESLVLYVKKSDSDDADDYLIYVILDSDDRIKAARQLIGWIDEAYIWE